MGTVFQAHDMCMTEGAGPIQDRSQEHLTTQDAAMVASRQLLMKGLRDVAAGKDPPGVVRDPAQNRYPPLFARQSSIIPLDADWKAHFHEMERTLEAEPARSR